MLVCGGLRIWRSVWTGVRNVVRNRRKRAGKHLAKAPRPKPKKVGPLPPRWLTPPGPSGAVPFWLERSFDRHALIFACSAAVGGEMGRWMLNLLPPVLKVATIFGTFPS